jgi:hypothetical protein
MIGTGLWSGRTTLPFGWGDGAEDRTPLFAEHLPEGMNLKENNLGAIQSHAVQQCSQYLRVCKAGRI